MEATRSGSGIPTWLVASMLMMVPQFVQAQVHYFIHEMEPVAAMDPTRPWGWAVRAYMNNPNQQLYNKAKAKLLAGEQVFSHTISNYNEATYCEQAPHYDFTWFEMQHSTLSFDEVRRMIAACPRVGAAPMIRMADNSEASIQRAVDIGVLGIVFATMESAIQARQAAMYSRFPPYARRSSGGGQASNIWQPAAQALGTNYRDSIDDNFLITVMIETPVGVENALEIASTPGIDVVILGNSDLSNFSGFEASSPEYQNLLTKVRNATALAGKFWGNAGQQFSSGNALSADSRFHQNGRSNDGWTPPGRGGGAGGGAGG